MDEEWQSFINEWETPADNVTIKFAATQSSLDIQPDLKNISSKPDFRECPNCHIQCKIDYSNLICDKCGYESSGKVNTQHDFSSASLECNTMSSSFVSFRFAGLSAQSYNRYMLKVSANYTKYQKNINKREMLNWNYNIEGRSLPKNVIKTASRLFATIKRHGYVYRVKCKKGVMSACLYYACIMHGISKTPNEIAAVVQIEEKFHSFGDRKLQDLNERGIIQIPTRVNPISDYTERYLQILGIDKKYKAFILDIIATAEASKIHIIHDSRNNTKVLGAIYLLIDRIPKYRAVITKEIIDEKCEISKTTFTRYYNVLCNNCNYLRNVFKRHAIPMKNEWRRVKVRAQAPKFDITDYYDMETKKESNVAKP